MSYPREIRTLVIEDETAMIETYKRYFQQFAQDGLPVAPVRIAQSFQDAEIELRRERVIHMVILDLSLPEDAGGAPEEASARGLELVGQISVRERYPIPVLLIVTGDVRRARPLTQIQLQLGELFYYGRIIEKTIDLATDLKKGIDAALQYCDVGLHLTGSSAEIYPLISPREEDLLRRCTLEEDDALGVDLRWWTADLRDRGASERPDWVKVLQGRFILLGDAGESRPRFFKFESVENGARSRAGARRLAQKVNHIQVIRSIHGSHRHLLVTDKAGPSNDDPLALPDLLVRSTAVEIRPHLPQLAADIAGQLQQLGDETMEELGTGQLLWPFHSAERLTEACKQVKLDGHSPIESLLRLQRADMRHWCNIRTRHGDLHIKNVSLDQTPGGVRAYIIDPGNMERGPAARDFASLEVSLMLHQRYDMSAGSLVGACKSLYDGSSPETASGLVNLVSEHHENTRALIQQLRLHALQQCKSPDTIAVLLLDEVLIQLGGLTFGTSQNRIYCESDARELFSYLRAWLESSGIIPQE